MQKKKSTSVRHSLVPDTNQVVSQLLGHLRRLTGLHSLRVVCNQYGLLCLHTAYALLALLYGLALWCRKLEE